MDEFHRTECTETEGGGGGGERKKKLSRRSVTMKVETTSGEDWPMLVNVSTISTLFALFLYIPPTRIYFETSN